MSILLAITSLGLTALALAILAFALRDCAGIMHQIDIMKRDLSERRTKREKLLQEFRERVELLTREEQSSEIEASESVQLSSVEGPNSL